MQSRTLEREVTEYKGLRLRESHRLVRVGGGGGHERAVDRESDVTSRERVMAALSGAAVDRPPVSFWGHFYERESSADDLVDATLESWRTFQWDWIKLNPRRQYHAEPWGVRWRYSGRAHEKPVLEEWPIDAPEDWFEITPRPADEGALGEQLQAVRRLRNELPAEVPLIETVFLPLAILREMVPKPDDVLSALDKNPEAVRAALEAVTVTFERFVPKLLEAGADGIFFATVDWATSHMLSAADHREWARPTDLRLMRAAAGASFVVLHVCKSDNLLAHVADYPAHAFSWAATDPSNPSLAEGLRLVKGAVMGGIAHEGALQDATPAAVLKELHRAHAETGDRRWLVAPGCSIPPRTPAANLHAVREAVEALRTIRGGAPA